jgi:hypothetical protein
MLSISLESQSHAANVDRFRDRQSPRASERSTFGSASSLSKQTAFILNQDEKGRTDSISQVCSSIIRGD